MLPQLAVNVGWLKLMGDPRTEQTKRQKAPSALPVSDAGKAHAARVKAAKRHARSPRRGIYGLVRAIQGRKPAA